MKIAFVTGGNRGLGLGFVKFLLNAGYRVIVGVRKPQKNKNDLFFVKLDVASDKSINQAFVQTSKITDHLDLFINNAGLNKDSATDQNPKLVSKLSELDRNYLLKMFNVNSISPLMLVKKFLPLLKNEAFIINISSGRSSYQDEYPNTHGNYGYRSSKVALNMMTWCSVHDLPKNVKIFAVHPGGVKSDMNPTGEHDPIEQAKKIIDITKNWKEEFNGKFLRFDGGFYPL